jgi:CubicO group peptidase (beta-lactamase class C family)
LTQRLLLAPLGMSHTTITLEPTVSRQLVPARDEQGAPASPWTFGALGGAGAYRSTIEDMAAFLRAAIERTPVPGLDWDSTWAMRRSAAGDKVALGWQRDDLSLRLGGIDQLVWHNGGTGGFSSYLGFDPTRRLGVVVLAARSHAEAVDGLGMHLLLIASHTSFAPVPDGTR